MNDTSVPSPARRLVVASLLIVALVGFPRSGHAQVFAKVEFSTYGEDPHPTYYYYNGHIGEIDPEYVPVLDPDPTRYYVFYYTGVVDPDARVPGDVAVNRYSIPEDQWEANRRWVILKLTLFYELTHRMQSTALQELTGQGSVATEEEALAPGAVPYPGGTQVPVAPGTAAPAPIPGLGGPPGFGGGPPGSSAPGFPGATGGPPGGGPGYIIPQATAAPTPEPTPFYGGMGMYPGAMGFGGPGMMPGMGSFGGGSAFGGGTRTFDAEAAAEWTFYYDQLVLWQYYCARHLIGEETDDLVEDLSQGGAEFSQDLVSQIDQLRPGGTLTGVDYNIDALLGQGTGRPGQPQPGLGGLESTVREIFDPQLDHEDSSRSLQYHEKFVEAAQQREAELVDNFMAMIDEIDRRDTNQQVFDQWMDNKRREVYTFAEAWRRAESGRAVVIDDSLFLITDEPLGEIPIPAINVIKSEQLTPQDIINDDGTIRQPQVF